jgi:hypothetical protein
MRAPPFDNTHALRSGADTRADNCADGRLARRIEWHRFHHADTREAWMSNTTWCGNSFALTRVVLPNRRIRTLEARP